MFTSPPSPPSAESPSSLITDQMRSPLDGVLVIDLSRALAGPHAAMMLGDLGARVIKVESPEGDESRRWGPPFVGADEISTYYMSANRNKESVTADLKSDDGRELLLRLVEQADVLIENFRPGVLARLGFSERRLHDINPRLVICSLTGFGHDGPESNRPGYDQIAQGEAGLMSVTGPGPTEPTKVGVPIGDLLAGLHGTIGIMTALYEREHTGRGRVVRASLLSSLVGVHAFQGTRTTVGGMVPRAEGNHHPSIAPYGLFHASDGPVQIACGNEAMWIKLCTAVGLNAAEAGFADNQQRVANRVELAAGIDRILATNTADHWLGLLTDSGIPAGRVRTLDEVYAWQQTRSQGLIIDVAHPALGSIQLPGPPIRFDDNPYGGGRREHLHPPYLGEHNESVREWLDQARAGSISDIDNDAATLHPATA